MQACPQVKGRYVNPHTAELRRTLKDVLLWKVGYYDEKMQGEIVPADFTYPLPQIICEPQRPSLQWINHCTFLISVGKINILTDPIWSKRCSPLPFFGPKRRHAPALCIYKLPKIHFVLISHDHYDHLDRSTVQDLHTLFPDITWLVPSGVKKWFNERGIQKVIELGWWDEVLLLCPDALDLRLRATAVPAQHFSGRSGRDFNRTLWAGWVLEFISTKADTKRLYFAGDSGYNPHDFKHIGEKWGNMDLGLIPIGTYVPRKFMAPVHVEPHDAVRIHRDVGSRFSIGMHWKTFHLSDEPANQPPYDLLKALESEGIDPATFLAVDPGHAINW